MHSLIHPIVYASSYLWTNINVAMKHPILVINNEWCASKINKDMESTEFAHQWPHLLGKLKVMIWIWLWNDWQSINIKKEYCRFWILPEYLILQKDAHTSNRRNINSQLLCWSRVFTYTLSLWKRKQEIMI
jgi:hypothetical protein